MSSLSVANQTSVVQLVQGIAVCEGNKKELLNGLKIDLNPVKASESDLTLVDMMQRDVLEVGMEAKKLGQFAIGQAWSFWTAVNGGQDVSSSVPAVEDSSGKLRTELNELKKEAGRLNSELSVLKAKIDETIKEKEAALSAHNTPHETPEEYTIRADETIKEFCFDYYKLNKLFLENLRKQTLLEGGDVTQIESAIQVALTVIESLDRKIKEQNLWKECKQALQDAFKDFSVKADPSLDDKLKGLLHRLENGENLTDEDLISIQNAFTNHSILDANSSEIKQRLKGLMTKYPQFARLIAGGAATGTGLLFAGPLGGFLAKMMVDKVLKDVLETSAPKSNIERIVVGVLETALNGISMGPMAAVVAVAANGAEAAPESVQTIAIGAATGVVASAAGISMPVAGGFSLASMLMFKNPRLFINIAKDFGHVWTVCRNERVTEIVKKIGFFITNQLVNNVDGMMKAWRLVDGKGRNQAIARASSIALSALAIVINFWNLPLSLGLFYIVNKYFEPKYEGVASLENAGFRNYLKEEVNHASGNRVDALLKVLSEEKVNGYNKLIEGARKPLVALA